MKQIATSILMLSFVLSIPIGSFAQYVRGDMSCSDYLEMNNGNAEEAERYVYWLGGVITGHAIATDQPLGKGINISCLQNYVQDMCEINEGDFLSASVVNLIEKLKKGGNKYLNSDACSLH